MAKRTQTRQRRAHKRSISVARGPAYITRKIPYFEFLGEEALCRIESHADWLLQEIGVEFRDDPCALQIWKSAGADIDGVRVRLPRGMARELCQTAPKIITQHARNPERTVKIGGNHAVFAPVYGPPFVRCLDKGRRYGTIEDFRNLVKLTSMLPWLHHSGGVTCEPCDVPVNKRHLDMLFSHLCDSDKPFLGAITTPDRAVDSIEMSKIAFGANVLEKQCVVMGNVNVNSPLMFDKVASEAIRIYCQANQGIIVVPFILGGAMGPVTTAAGIAQALAEAMVGGAFSQLVRPGAPFILGNFLSSMSLRSGAPTFGMPEPVMSNYVIGQLARRLELPMRCGGSLTAAKLPDTQAAFESADSMHSTVIGGANFILHAAGWLEAGLVTSYEKLILDADRLGAYHAILSGISVNENTLASDAYREVEPGGHFLGSRHTLANYETAFYEAQLSNSESFEQWTEEGSKDATTRANLQWKQMLKDYESPKNNPSITEALKEYVEKKKLAVEDTWY